jgi:hypothetical protein
MQLLHGCVCFISSSSLNVYAIVTWLCASFDRVLKMFMQLLHGCFFRFIKFSNVYELLHGCVIPFTKFSKCVCNCLIAVCFVSSSSQIVYVIVTWLCYSFHQVLKFSKCVCNCYMAVSFPSSSSLNVYVIVT